MNFAANDFSVGDLGEPRLSWSAAGAAPLLGAGTYRVGFCVAGQTGPITIDRTGNVNGWVMVTQQ
jgi:hypothetical protein